MTNLQRTALALATALAAILAWSVPAQAESITSRLCNVDQVAVFENRIHIKCVADPKKAYTTAIPYYAMAISSDAKVGSVVANIIALAVGAKETKKPVVVWFDMDDYRSVPGCQGNNCRKLVGAALE